MVLLEIFLQLCHVLQKGSIRLAFLNIHRWCYLCFLIFFFSNPLTWNVSYRLIYVQLYNLLTSWHENCHTLKELYEVLYQCQLIYWYCNLIFLPRTRCFIYFIGRSTLVGQRPMKSLSSVCPSVRPSLNFPKIISLAFSDILRDDSRPWYLVTDGDRFLK